MRRRGFTLLLVVGMLMVLSFAVATLVNTASVRYHHAQTTRDRLQALECAQAGIIWAREQIAASIDIGSATIALGADTRVHVECTNVESGWVVESVGETLRNGEMVSQRRLTITMPPTGGQP